MTRYTATIKHNSISRSRIIQAGDTIKSAKTKATSEFGGEFNDYEIVIFDTDFQDQIVATRRISNPKWEDRA